MAFKEPKITVPFGGENAGPFGQSQASAIWQLPFWARYSVPLRLTFPAANTSRDVQHGLQVIPDGMLMVRADANIFAVPGKQWTEDIAYLQADRANARATVVFFTMRESASDA